MSPRLLTPLILLTSFAGIAQAQRTDVGLFRPPATSNGILDVDSAFSAPHLSVFASLYGDYARNPLVLNGSLGSQMTVIGDQYELQLGLGIALWNRLEVGVSVPLVLHQNGQDDVVDGVPDATLGDVRIGAKLFLGRIKFGGGRSVGFGLGAELSLPTGDSLSFSSDADVTFQPRVLASFDLHPVELLFELGAILRTSREFYGVSVGQELHFGVAARLALYKGLGIAGSFDGEFPVTGNTGTNASPLELLGGPDYRFNKVPIELSLAFGGGLTDAPGAPDLRVVFGIRYQPRNGDRDGDGVSDNDDACPDDKGPRENHGCPDRDDDGDGIIDRLDRCPHEAGIAELEGCPDQDSDGDSVVDRLDKCPNVAGLVENQGCPDVDSDGDGVVDRLDECPKEAGMAELKGCPDRDGDGDGVVDRLDKCPTQAGPKENGGCPDTDSDGDGIVDRLDKCPTQPETFNGFQDDDGCPDKGPELVKITADKIELAQQIFFETGKAVISKGSAKLMATLGKILVLHPEILLLRIEGHTDNVGGHDANVKLSQARADAVRSYLIDVLGIAPERLIAKGFGPDQPIADNATSAGRARNRRSAFVIEKRDAPVPVPAPQLPKSR